MDYYNYDLIIVGGGIAGLYTAYRLQNNFRILLIEKNGYIGGRIHTNTLTYKGKKFRYECGAGRLPTNHYRIMNLLKELNLSDRLVKLGNSKTFISVDDETLDVNLDFYIKDFMDKARNKSEKYIRNHTLHDFYKLYDEGLLNLLY